MAKKKEKAKKRKLVAMSLANVFFFRGLGKKAPSAIVVQESHPLYKEISNQLLDHILFENFLVKQPPNHSSDEEDDHDDSGESKFQVWEHARATFLKNLIQCDGLKNFKFVKTRKAHKTKKA